jgi:hypothetical protein
LAFFSYLIPIILFLVFARRRSGLGLWVIFFYILISYSFDIFNAIAPFGKDHEEEAFAVFTIFEFSAFATFFYLAISSVSVRKFILLSSILILVFLTISFYKSDKSSFDSISASTESITMIVFSILFFFEELKKPMPYILYSYPNFWIVFGILVFMAATLFLFITANKLSPEEHSKYWIILNVANIISNLIFGIGFIRARFLPSKSATGRSDLKYSSIPENHRKLEP